MAWARSPVTCEGLGFSLRTCISNKLLLLPVPWTQLPYSENHRSNNGSVLDHSVGQSKNPCPRSQGNSQGNSDWW